MDKEPRASTKTSTPTINRSKSLSYLRDDKISSKNKTIKPSQSCIYHTKLTTPKKDMSYLISNNSKIISEEVSYIPVLDRLTCDYLVPEAKSVLRRSKSLSNIQEENEIAQDFNFESTMLSAILPNTLSYVDLTTFMRSPQHIIRRRGQTPSFEKMLQLYTNSPKRKYHGPFVLIEFLKRDQELIDKKQQMATPPPPQKMTKYLTDNSQRIAKLAIRKRSQMVEIKNETSTPETNTKTQKSPKSKNKPKCRLTATTEVMANIKKLRQEITRIENENELKKTEKEIRKQNHYISPQIKKRADRAQARREAAQKEKEKPDQEISTPKQKQFYHKIPGYMSDVTSFMEKQKKRERYDKLPEKTSAFQTPKKA